MESSVGPYRPTQTHMRIALVLVGGSESSNISLFVVAYINYRN